MGVKLIDFRELSNIDAWVKDIKLAKTTHINIDNNIHVLTERGFDIKENASKLLELYKTMENNFKYVN